MVISPLLRGLFGIMPDVPDKILYLGPHLPADWDHAALHNVAFGASSMDINFERSAGKLSIRAATRDTETFCICTDLTSKCTPTASQVHTAEIQEPAVQITFPTSLPDQGAETSELKVLDEQTSAHQAIFRFEAQAQSAYDLPVRLNRPNITVAGAELSKGKLHLTFPAGTGYEAETVTFRW
jgi:hypothetical protein